jgi:FtsH-binding integral membrane protein
MYNLIYSICLVVGIITFRGYVAYDTARMYKRFRDGQYKYCYHAFGLLLDIINLFLDILRILVKFKKD